jgi:hypothetical protein
MNFGYLIVVSESEKSNYAKLAYALALSIKNTQKPGYDRVALVISDKDRIKEYSSPWVFDHIIEWNEETHWNGRSHMDELSPFDYTVCLDADMLFMRDYSHWVDYFVENCELYIANRAYTYRGNVVTSDYYRKCFTANKLPNLYSFYTFFKKDSKLAKEFFALQRAIIKNPVEFSNNFLTAYKPKVVGTDEAFALAVKILDVADEVAYPLEFPKVVHMKGMVQDWPWPAETVSDHVGFYFNPKAQLKIGNYQQHDIVHYVEKDAVTLETINILEEIAWKKN